VFATGYDADAIWDFQNGKDKIDVTDFGFSAADLNNLISSATQVGSHVNLDFGGGDTLQIRSFDLALLDASDFITSGAAELPDAGKSEPSLVIAEVMEAPLEDVGTGMTDTVRLAQDLIAEFIAGTDNRTPYVVTNEQGVFELMTEDDPGFDWGGFAGL